MTLTGMELLLYFILSMLQIFSKIKNLFSPNAWKEKYERYERHISSIALVSGFILDSITLNRIDRLFENAILFFYLIVAGLGIILINLSEQGRWGGRFSRFHTFFLILIQFSFGALFSAFTIFYFRSSSLAVSWPFILFLAGLLIANELLKTRYQKLIFQITIFFVTIFSLTIFYVPIITKTLGVWTFIISGIVSLVLITLFIYLLYRFVPERVVGSKKALATSIGVIFLIINLLYFTNIIPPIPLSLKEAEVFHLVEKNPAGGYKVEREVRPWYEFLFPFERVTLVPNKPLYVLSSVFAPTNLNTDIVHEWQYFDEKTKRWATAGEVRFAIEGGADGGYRGFSQKSNLFSGYWRVDIETPRGQMIGRLKFKIIDSQKSFSVESQIK